MKQNVLTGCRECAVDAYERVKNQIIDGKSGKLCGRWNVRCKKEDGKWCEKKKTKIRRCRKYVALDGVILWKAKRTWLMVRMITTVGSCSKFQTRASFVDDERNKYAFYAPNKRWILLCESRESFCMRFLYLEWQAIDCRPIIIVHQHSSYALILI